MANTGEPPSPFVYPPIEHIVHTALVANAVKEVSNFVVALKERMDLTDSEVSEVLSHVLCRSRYATAIEGEGIDKLCVNVLD